MKTDYSEYQNILEELLEMLQTYNEEHWAEHFKESLNLLNNGKPQKSISYSLSAYGGMCSFKDTLLFTGASEDKAKRGFSLSDDLLIVASKEQCLIRRVIEF